MINNTSVEIGEETSLPGPRPRPINQSTDNHEKNEERSTLLQHTHHIEKKQRIFSNFISVKLLLTRNVRR